MNSLKLSVGLNSFFLSLIGMFLANLVVLVFWYGDIVSREARALSDSLSLLVDRDRGRGAALEEGDGEPTVHNLV